MHTLTICPGSKKMNELKLPVIFGHKLFNRGKYKYFIPKYIKKNTHNYEIYQLKRFRVKNTLIKISIRNFLKDTVFRLQESVH